VFAVIPLFISNFVNLGCPSPFKYICQGFDNLVYFFKEQLFDSLFLVWFLVSISLILPSFGFSLLLFF
jgi:hypothetical protein